MPFNNKRRRKAALKAQFKRASGAGGKSDVQSTGNVGPRRTTKVNTKKNTWFSKLAGKPSAAPTKPKQEQTEAATVTE